MINISYYFNDIHHKWDILLHLREYDGNNKILPGTENCLPEEVYPSPSKANSQKTAKLVSLSYEKRKIYSWTKWVESFNKISFTWCEAFIPQQIITFNSFGEKMVWLVKYFMGQHYFKKGVEALSENCKNSIFNRHKTNSYSIIEENDNTMATFNSTRISEIEN